RCSSPSVPKRQRRGEERAVMFPKLNVFRLLDCFLSACARTLRSRPDSDERRLVSTDNRRRPLVFLALLTAALVLTAGLVGRPDAKGELSAPLSVPPDSTEGEVPDGDLLVKFRPGASASEIARLHASANAAFVSDVADIGVKRLKVPPRHAHEAAENYSRSPAV